MSDLVLIIEDEPGICDNVEFALQSEGFKVKTAHTGELGLSLHLNNSFSVIILDIGLPDINGFELFKKLKEIKDIPVIFLTARDSEVDKVLGLELGGDDYVTKPFSPRVLVARVKAVLRRYKKIEENKNKFVIEYGPFTLDCEKKIILYYKRKVEFSRYEYLIMERFITHPGHVYSREKLLQLIWDEPTEPEERTIDTHIKVIRGKLKKISGFNDPIVTHRGFGYSLRDEL